MKQNWFLLPLGIGLVILIVYRAYHIPFTHDESTTWLSYRHINLWPCFYEASCWASANNHWLNSLLMQWSAKIGGDIPGVLRWPNEIAGALYILAAGLIVTRYVTNYAWQVFGFLLLCAHIYLLDFFSLARGYGMMTAATLWGMYSMLRYSEDFQWKWFTISIVSLCLGVLSNFTGLLPLMAVYTSWFFWLVISRRYPLIWKHGYVLLITAFVLFLALHYPLKILSHGGEFEWGADNLLITGRDLFSNLLAHGTYFGWHSPERLMYYVSALVVISFCCFLIQKKYTDQGRLTLAFLFLGSLLAILFALQVFTGAKDPIGRKSVFLIPLFFLPLVLSQVLIKRKWIVTTLGVIGTYVLLVHFFFMARDNMYYSREWYYDAYYPEVFSAIVPEQSESDSVRVGASWIFVLSMSFYTATQSLPIAGLAYQKDLVIDSTMDYYFIQPDEAAKMDSTSFVLDRKIGPFLLYKKDPGQ